MPETGWGRHVGGKPVLAALRLHVTVKLAAAVAANAAAAADANADADAGNATQICSDWPTSCGRIAKQDRFLQITFN